MGFLRQPRGLPGLALYEPGCPVFLVVGSFCGRPTRRGLNVSRFRAFLTAILFSSGSKFLSAHITLNQDQLRWGKLTEAYTKGTRVVVLYETLADVLGVKMDRRPATPRPGSLRNETARAPWIHGDTIVVIVDSILYRWPAAFMVPSARESFIRAGDPRSSAACLASRILRSCGYSRVYP
jgi:hypothetical protein